MVAQSGALAVAFLVGRALFGILAVVQGANHFLNRAEMAGYAESKGVPAPTVAVLGSGLLLVAGGLGIALGAYPALAAGALVVFFLGVTPLMHDFWALSGEEAQQQLVHFMKNVMLLAAALVFLSLSGEAWPYALGVGLVQ